MKTLKSLLLTFTIVLTLQSYGQNVTLTGTVDSQFDNQKVVLFSKGIMMREKAAGEIDNGKFTLSTQFDGPSFVLFSTPVKPHGSLDLFLMPNDKMEVTISKDKIVFSGSNSDVNNMMATLNASFPYNHKNSEEQNRGVYLNRIKYVENSNLLKNKTTKNILLGYLQGQYLDNVWGQYISSKVFGKSDGIDEVKFGDLNIQFLPTIIYHNNWLATVTEVMFAKMRKGELKIKNVNDWVAIFANEIKDQTLREAYIVNSLERSVLFEDFVGIDETINAALPLVKDKKNSQTIKNLMPEIKSKSKKYANVPVGEDMSSYTFTDRDGKTVSISDFKGKYIFIDIWNIGCSPCIAEIPFLKKIEHDLAKQEIVFLSASLDGNVEKWKEFLDKRNITGHQLLIPGSFKGEFFTKIGPSGIPRFVIIDKEGKMCDYNSSKRPSNPLLKVYLTQLLNKK